MPCGNLAACGNKRARQRVDALQSADRSAPFRSKLRRTGTSDLFQTCFKHSRQQACNAVRHHNSPIGPPCPAQACGALRIGHSTTTTTTTHHHHLAHNHTASLLVGTASHTLCSGGCKESGGCCAGFVKPAIFVAWHRATHQRAASKRHPKSNAKLLGVSTHQCKVPAGCALLEQHRATILARLPRPIAGAPRSLRGVRVIPSVLVRGQIKRRDQHVAAA